jgi:hypothetical protein
MIELRWKAHRLKGLAETSSKLPILQWREVDYVAKDSTVIVRDWMDVPVAVVPPRPENTADRTRWLNGWPTAVMEMSRLLDECARLATENELLLQERDMLERRARMVAGSNADDWRWYQNAAKQAVRALDDRRKRGACLPNWATKDDLS